jgi:hypothetical protein
MSTPFQIEVLDQGRVIIGHFNASFRVADHAREYLQAVLQPLTDAPDGSYYITEALQFSVSFGDLVAGLSLVTRGETDITTQLRRHHMIMVVQNKLLEIGANAFGQSQYGGLNAQIYSTLDEALAVTRARMAA